MKLAIIINNTWKFRTDWRNLLGNNELKIILITSTAGKNNLASEQHACFEKIVITEDFSLNTLKALIAPLLSTQPENETTINTTDERLIQIAGQLRDHFNLLGDSGDILGKFRDKIVMKQYLSDKKITLPKYIHFSSDRYSENAQDYITSITDYLGFSILAKPIDAGGSRGISIINNQIELMAWCEQHASDKNYELDEFIVGKFYNTDTIVKDGEIIKTLVCEHLYPNDVAIRESKPIATILLQDSDPTSVLLKEFTSDVLNAMQPIPQNSVFDLDVFVDSNKKPIFIEIAARSPGGMLTEIYAKNLNGLHLEETHFRLQIGLPTIFQNLSSDIHAAYVWVPKQTGTVEKINPPKLQCEHTISFCVKPGEQIVAAEGISDIAAAILIWSADYAKLKEDFNSLDMHRFYTLEPE
jgi:D-ala D-ala ligase C-terminus